MQDTQTWEFKVIHFSTLPSSFSSFWEMTTWTKLDITPKQISQTGFCKKILSDRWELQLLYDIYRLNVWGMIFSLNQMLKVSPNLQLQFISKISWAYLTFFTDVEDHEVPSNCTKSFLKLGKDFLYSHLSFTAAYSLKSEEDWPIDFAKLWSRESDSVYNHESWEATNRS